MLHCCLWSVYRYKTVHIFLLLVPGSENITEYKICVLSCSANLYMKFRILNNNSEKYCRKCTSVLMYSTCYFLQILINAEFSRHILATYLKKISWKLVQWQKRCFMRTYKLTDAQTDSNKDANCLFRISVNAPVNI